ncbi:hypothetical protein BLNAU_11479 [Blattamonas nauphoetae]|uniref:Uncharacterized protein n=1 Tax=Blattamonas nauphoetae TaxID=2049346 RepID=A0ABQ9XQ49_9EUKA|nr:hypothetical protein BLNAU_11479 [Blattamonas nauphoetae]
MMSIVAGPVNWEDFWEIFNFKTKGRRMQDFKVATFDKIGESSPPSAVISTLARISLFPHLRIAFSSLLALYKLIQRDPPTLTQLPSPIFPSSSPFEQYSGLSFLAALTKKLRIVFSEFQRNLPTDPSHLPKFIQVTKDDLFIITRSLDNCSYSVIVTTFFLRANPRIEVDSEIIRELILFVKESITTVLTNISNIDTLIASLPSDSSPTTPCLSVVKYQIIDSLNERRNEVTCKIADPRKSSFQTIMLDDPSFPDLILNSLKLNRTDFWEITIKAINNIVIVSEWMRLQFIAVNLVERMFETVDFVSLPFSESETLYRLTKFIACMTEPIGDDDEVKFEQYRLIRVSVFEPAKQFITFIVNNQDKLILDEEDTKYLESYLCWIRCNINNMERRSDEHDADIVSELVKWEMRTMVEMENEVHFERVFQSMLIRTQEWNRDKRERQKRREVRLREDGWDDAFELRVVGIEVGTNQNIHDSTKTFSIELALNTDRR